MMRLSSLVLLAALAAACTTTKQSRVRTALLDAGVPKPLAECMAEPLGRDLSVSQLRSLQRVSALGERRINELNPREVIDMLQKNLDPETVGVVTRAGFGCMVRG